MKQYHLKDGLCLGKEKALAVENDEGELVGYIEKVHIPECEKGHTFLFTNNKDTFVRIGIKKRNIKDVFAPTYLLHTPDHHYRLKDKVGNNLLYFCVLGNIDEKSILIEENWSGDVEVKVEGEKISTIKSNDVTIKTTFHVIDNLDESSVLFGVTILMYFMYKIYKNESAFMQELLFD